VTVELWLQSTSIATPTAKATLQGSNDLARWETIDTTSNLTSAPT
jgi:hypothetical protein